VLLTNTEQTYDRRGPFEEHRGSEQDRSKGACREYYSDLQKKEALPVGEVPAEKAPHCYCEILNDDYRASAAV